MNTNTHVTISPMSATTSPVLTPRRHSRAGDDVVHHDFGADVFSLTDARTDSTARHPGIVSVHSRAIGGVTAVGGSASVKSIDFKDHGFTPLQCASHREMDALLKEYPPLDGFIAPTKEQLNCFEPLKKYLSLVLCKSLEECDSTSLRLQSLISILRKTRGFQHVSDAVVAAAVIHCGFQDNSSWHYSLTGKLNQWNLRAYFWDVHLPACLLTPSAHGFHHSLLRATKELNIGPVCLTGHSYLVPVIYQQYMLMKVAMKPVQKMSVDCLADIFMFREAFLLLSQTLNADVMDGLSVPLPSLPPEPENWTHALLRVAAVATKPGFVMLSEHLKTDLVSAARPYAWMLVAAQKVAKPDTEFPSTVKWDTAFIGWDEADE